MSDFTAKWRAKWPFAVLVVVCAAVVAAVLGGAVPPLSATQFASVGHWVYNSVRDTVLHIDGATSNIDARMGVDGIDDVSQVLQNEVAGFVVGKKKIIEFDKASLSARAEQPSAGDEVPQGIEVVGGPYVIYRESGIIDRLGDPAARIRLDGPVGDAVATDDGTVWTNRVGDGRICRLDKNEVTLSGCPMSAPRDHHGALTVLADRPAFLDLFTGRLHDLGDDRFGQGIQLDVTLSSSARPAARDAGGILPILDPVLGRLVLVDITDPAARPLMTPLPSGDYDKPMATGEVVVLLDRQNGVVRTYGTDGRRKDEESFKDTAGTLRLAQGDDGRIYVEDGTGTQVKVVDERGLVREVDTERPTTSTTTTTTPPASPPRPPGTPPAPPPGRPETDSPQRERPEPRQVPVPASRPGAPGAVNAVAGNGRATVSWSAAPRNGAAVTSYTVSWQGGSRTVGGLRTEVAGLTNGVRYVFTVAATNRVGTGPGVASNPVTPVPPPPPPPTVVVSKGPATEDSCGEKPDCAWMHFELTNFPPNTSVDIQPFSNDPGYSNGGATLTTDDNGFQDGNRFAYTGPDEVVWIVVTLPDNRRFESNRLTW